MEKIAPYAKAVIAFVGPGIVSVALALNADSAGGTAITTGEWLNALVVCLTTSGLVYAVPNRAPRGGAS